MSVTSRGMRVTNADRAEQGRAALNTYLAQQGLAADPSGDHSPHQVQGLITALLHLLDTADSPADVLARALVDYDEQARAEDTGNGFTGFNGVGGELIAAVLDLADKECTTDAINTLLYGLIGHNERRD
jgi:hypothetical protein